MGAGHGKGIEISGSSMGYQVLRVYPNSPGSRADLQPYFDFIIGTGSTRFHTENATLLEIIKASMDQKLKLFVFNTRLQQIREVEIVPSANWGGNGLLGVSIKHGSFDCVDDRVWHVLNVQPNSPAFKAGLQSNVDYVIGLDSGMYNDDLYSIIEAHDRKALKLFVYNTNTDDCREVIIYPNSQWGGQGFLGCEFGHGLLHRIPTRDKGENVSDVNTTERSPLVERSASQYVTSSAQANNAYGQSQPIHSNLQTSSSLQQLPPQNQHQHQFMNLNYQQVQHPQQLSQPIQTQQQSHQLPPVHFQQQMQPQVSLSQEPQTTLQTNQQQTHVNYQQHIQTQSSHQVQPQHSPQLSPTYQLSQQNIQQTPAVYSSLSYQQQQQQLPPIQIQSPSSHQAFNLQHSIQPQPANQQPFLQQQEFQPQFSMLKDFETQPQVQSQSQDTPSS